MLRYCWSSFDLYLNGKHVDNFLHPLNTADLTEMLQPSGNVLCLKLTGHKTGGDFPVSGLVGCAFWLQPQLNLAPTISLLGPWTSYAGDWTTSSPVTLTGADTKLTAEGVLKPGINPILTNHLVRDLDLPAAWRGKQIYVHAVSPQMNSSKPFVILGLTSGMLLVNGHALLFGGWPNAPLDEMLNVTPYVKCGQANRFELWPREAARGSMSEIHLTVNDLVLGCGTE